MNSEEWARSEGRELNPEGDSAVMSCSGGDEVGGGRRGHPGGGRAQVGRWE